MKKNRQVLIFEDSYKLTNYLLKKFTELGSEAIEQRGRFTVAFPGGQTPLEFYCKLSNYHEFDFWLRTHIFLSDERFVPLDDKESNYKLIHDNLLSYVNMPSRNMHYVPTESGSLEDAAEEYKNHLLSFFDTARASLPRFDFMLLGIGDDGHTASLFPWVENIDHPQRWTIPVSSNHLKNERISLSLSVINNSKTIIFMVMGKNKAKVIQTILEETSDLPAAKVCPTDGELIFLLDRDSASQLTIKEPFTDLGEAISL